MLSATGTLNSSTSLELSWGRAANSLNYNLQLDKLFRANAGVSALPLLYPDAVQADFVPYFRFHAKLLPKLHGIICRRSNIGRHVRLLVADAFFPPMLPTPFCSG